MTVDGRDHGRIEQALTMRHTGRPHAVIATTETGR